MSEHEKLDERDLRYFKFAFGRAQGWADKRIIEELNDPDIDSPQALYRRLSQDDYPVCPECGMAPVQTKHCEPPRRRRNPGVGTGQRRELPSAARAAGLFQERLEALQALLHNAENLEHRQEVYQDRRFPGADVYEGTLAFARYRRDKDGRRVENYSEEEWQNLCEQYDHNPHEEVIGVADSPLQVPTEAAPVPPEPLTTLIGVYALAGGPMSPLLDALYPGEPSEEVVEAVRKCVEGKWRPDKTDGLKALAGRLAIWVRGGKPEGAPPPALSAAEYDAACYISQLREEGRSDKEIRRRLSNHRKPNGSNLTDEDISRLGKMYLRYPRT